MAARKERLASGLAHDGEDGQRTVDSETGADTGQLIQKGLNTVEEVKSKG